MRLPGNPARRSSPSGCGTWSSAAMKMCPCIKSGSTRSASSPRTSSPSTILTKLPFTTKQDLRDTYPFGLIAVPRDDLARIHASSGTTGKQTVVGYTEQRPGHLGPQRCPCHCRRRRHHMRTLSMCPMAMACSPAAWASTTARRRWVPRSIPVSSGNTKRQVQILQDYGSDILCCTPSYAMYIGETVRDKGIDPNSLRVRIGIFGAEPWTEEMRREIEKALAIKAYDIYGLSEIAGPGVACECQRAKGDARPRGLLLSRDHRPRHRRTAARWGRGRAGVHLHRQRGACPSSVTAPGTSAP